VTAHPDRAATVWARGLLTAAVGVLVVATLLLRDGALAARTVLALLAGLVVALSLRAGWPTPGWTALGLYIAFAPWVVVAALVNAAAVSWSAAAWQASFPALVLAIGSSVGTAHDRARLVALLVTGLWLVLVPAVAWGADPAGPRIGIYLATLQWSGYPELGLLATIGFGMTAAVASIGVRPLTRGAAAMLAVSFAAMTVALGSRAAAATTAVVALLLAFSRYRRHRATMALAGLAGLGVAATAVLWMPALSEMPEAALRLDSWSRALTAIRDHPVAGLGPGRFPASYPGEHAHNVWLHMAVEIGLPGMMLFAGMVLRGVGVTGRLREPLADRAVAFAVHGGLLAFLVRSQVDHFLAPATTTYVRCWLLLAVLLGLAESYGRATRRSASVNAAAGGTRPADRRRQ
jgi:O-antigen ligase